MCIKNSPEKSREEEPLRKGLTFKKLNLWVMIHIFVFFSREDLRCIHVHVELQDVTDRLAHWCSGPCGACTELCILLSENFVWCLLCFLPTRDVYWIPVDGSGFYRYLQEHFPFLGPFKVALCSGEVLGPGYVAVNEGLREEQPEFEVLMG